MMQVVDHDLLRFQELLKVNCLDFLQHLQYMQHKGEIELFERETKR